MYFTSMQNLNELVLSEKRFTSFCLFVVLSILACQETYFLDDTQKGSKHFYYIQYACNNTMSGLRRVNYSGYKNIMM